MAKLKDLAGDTVIYGVSSILGRLLNYLLTPLYTTKAVLSLADYGTITEFYAYTAFLNVIYTYGMETTYFRFATKKGNSESEVFNEVMSLMFMTTLVLTVVLTTNATSISTGLGYPGKASYILWFAGILAVDALAAVPFAKLRLQRKARYFAFVKILTILITIALNLFFLLFCPAVVSGKLFPEWSALILKVYNPEWSVEYVFLSNLLANSLQFVLLIGQFKSFRPRVVFSHLHPLFSYALPILFTGLAGQTNEMLSRAMLKYVLPPEFYPGKSNLEALGVFGACYKLSIFMNLTIQAFRYAAEPFFFSHAEDKQSPQLFSRVMHWFIILATLIFMGVSLNLDWIAPIFIRSSEYLEGLYIVPTLLMAGLFLGIYFNLSVWYKLTDKTYYGALFASIGAVITVVLNLLLIPVLGYYGSALTTLITYLVMVVLSLQFGQRHYPIPYQVKSGVFYITLAGLLTAIGYYVAFDIYWLTKLFQFLLFLGYVGIILIRERNQLKLKVN